MTIKAPTTAEGLQEVLSDPAKVREFFSESAVKNGLTKEFLNVYAREFARSDPDMRAQVNEQVQASLQEFLTAGGDETREKIGARLGSNGRPEAVAGDRVIGKGRGAVYNKFSPGAQLERKFAPADRFGSIGELCLAIREEARPTSISVRDDLMRKMANVRSFQNSFGSEDPGAGGFLIPEEMRAELLQLALEESIVRSRATVIPMSTLRVPVPTVDDISHVSSLFGGVTYYWAEESAQLPESQATFGRVVLDAKKLTGFFKVPNELLSDAPAFSAWFDSRVPMGLAWTEDAAFMTETGAGTPQGFIGSPAYLEITRDAGDSGTIYVDYVDIVTMYSRMLPQSLSSAVWIASIDTFPSLAQMGMSQDSPGVWFGGWASRDATDAPPISIMGRPVFFTEKVGPAGSVGDITFVDLSYYLIGDRQTVAVAASDQYAFQNDQMSYRIIERVDGRPWLQSPLTPHNGGATLSAFVGLAAS